MTGGRGRSVNRPQLLKLSHKVDGPRVGPGSTLVRVGSPWRRGADRPESLQLLHELFRLAVRGDGTRGHRHRTLKLWGFGSSKSRKLLKINLIIIAHSFFRLHARAKHLAKLVIISIFQHVRLIFTLYSFD